MANHPVPTITVGHLRQALAGYPDDYDISFSGLTYYRVKQRGDRSLQIEFNQQVFLDDQEKVVVQNLE